ncbi:MAG TPA: hypothetical protein P5572_13055, partial [Phycisphaerae bacterium]|nr:hypothetical protein [Phycisphaerae bacterium]
MPVACDDGDPCTTGDVCSATGMCTGTLFDCSSLDGPCTVGQCSAGTCVAMPLPNGIACDDNSACTVSDTCVSGTCLGNPVICDDFDACTIDTCDTSSGCVHTPSGATCDDGDPCTVSDVCTVGGCIGVPKDCSAHDDACHVGACNSATGACQVTTLPNGTPCDDGNPNTTNDVCLSGICMGAP